MLWIQVDTWPWSPTLVNVPQSGITGLHGKHRSIFRAIYLYLHLHYMCVWVGICICVLWNSHSVFHSGSTLLCTHWQGKRIKISLNPHNPLHLILGSSHSNGHEEVSRCVSDLGFPNY